MNDYVQPDFYRFNEDSLKLVSWIAARGIQSSHLIDLGAGSGVIGIELANRLKIPNLTFLEVQKDFLPFLNQNIREQLKVQSRTNVINCSFGEWTPESRYDLIVCNPPYYLTGHGEVSKNSGKLIARSFAIDNWEILLHKTEIALSPGGKAFFVMKNDPRILKEIRLATFALRIEQHEIPNLLILELSGLNVD